MFETLGKSAVRPTTRELAAAAIVWGPLVILAAGSGLLRFLYPPLIGPLVALGIVVPMILYFLPPALHAYFRSIGLYPLTVFHVWRIPAALVSFGSAPTAHCPPPSGYLRPAAICYPALSRCHCCVAR